MSTWKGFDVLEIVPVKSAAGPVEVSRPAEVVDNRTGLRHVKRLLPATASTESSRRFGFWLRNRTETAAFRTFLTARRGRSVPFWMPWYQQEMSLMADAAYGAGYLRITPCGYRGRWLANQADVNIVLTLPGVSWCYETIESVSDSTPGEEQVFITPAVARVAGWPAATTKIYGLRFCRLENDAVTITWHSSSIGLAELSVRELPLEVPVS
jgi:hypothetical protein